MDFMAFERIFASFAPAYINLLHLLLCPPRLLYHTPTSNFIMELLCKYFICILLNPAVDLLYATTQMANGHYPTHTLGLGISSHYLLHHTPYYSRNHRVGHKPISLTSKRLDLFLKTEQSEHKPDKTIRLSRTQHATPCSHTKPTNVSLEALLDPVFCVRFCIHLHCITCIAFLLLPILIGEVL
jgi:hypothetical protein